MPFVAKCKNCGYITHGNTRPLLNICMEEHDSESHKDTNKGGWTITIFSAVAYTQLVRNMKNPKFWQTIRSLNKIPVF